MDALCAFWRRQLIVFSVYQQLEDLELYFIPTEFGAQVSLSGPPEPQDQEEQVPISLSFSFFLLVFCFCCTQCLWFRSLVCL